VLSPNLLYSLHTRLFQTRAGPLRVSCDNDREVLPSSSSSVNGCHHDGADAGAGTPPCRVTRVLYYVEGRDLPVL
jgi:hypothetical protein